MSKTVTRACVSDNFCLYWHGQKQNHLDKKLLVEITDHWKVVFLEKLHLTRGNIIGLGFPLTDIHYFGALLAACELGLKLVVLDLFFDNWMANARNKKFWTMDLFLAGPGLSDQSKLQFQNLSRAWADYTVCRNSIDPKRESRSRTDVVAQESDELLLCTSSGTTGPPKKIKHTHEFIWEVSTRNQRVFEFYGNVLHLRNLHHGSSLPVYFLPTLMSDRVTCHHTCNFNASNLLDPTTIDNLIRYAVTHDINHIQFPYTDALDAFLRQSAESGIKFKDLTLYTLSYIKPEWLPMIERCNIKQIISIFGCNETSGPVFINSLMPGQTDFAMTEFRLLDDFYGVSITENKQLAVSLPTYNQNIIMQDSFEQQNEKFIHHGRSDLIRINDIEIELFYILNLCEKHNINGQCTVDKQYERIYLALWSDDPNAIKVLDHDLSEKYNETIRIYQSMVINKSDYMVGIKLDHDLIRERFRNEKSTSN